MSRDTLYQSVRGHLAYLKLAAAAEALPGELETAIKEKRNHTEFLERLLAIEVTAVEARRHAGLRTYYTTAADLAARCRKAAVEGRWATTMRFFNGPSVLIVDELGYLPMPAEDANALFQVVSQRYLRGSIILTTNRGVGGWGDIFADTTIAAAMLDRLLHRSVVINISGDSYRMRAHRARNRKLTEGGDA